MLEQRIKTNYPDGFTYTAYRKMVNDEFSKYLENIMVSTQETIHHFTDKELDMLEQRISTKYPNGFIC